ncbi:MAG: type III secretion system outer membrane ring subunit SctC [Pseudomonadota bacterium]
MADAVIFQGGREFVIPGVASILRSMIGDGSQPAATSLYFSQPEDQTIPGLRGKGLRQHAVSNQQNQDDAKPIDITSGGVATHRNFVTRIEAERNLNAVIVRDYADSMPLYAQLIHQLDKEPLLIEIQVTIIDVDKSKLQDLGVDWQYQDSNINTTFGGGNVANQNGGVLFNTVLGETGRFLARVNALATEGSANVVSRPQVMTLSNLEAVLSSDQQFFVRIAGQEEVDLFNVTVGTSLRVVPNIVGDQSDPQIRLLVAIEDGSIVPDAAVDEIPVVEKATLNTQAMIYNGESLLLGGLVRESTNVEERGVPGLRRVPGVGRLFKRKTDVAITAERLFLITPKIVSNQRTAKQSSSTRPRYDVQSATPKVYLDGF